MEKYFLPVVKKSQFSGLVSLNWNAVKLFEFSLLVTELVMLQVLLISYFHILSMLFYSLPSSSVQRYWLLAAGFQRVMHIAWARLHLALGILGGKQSHHVFFSCTLWWTNILRYKCAKRQNDCCELLMLKHLFQNRFPAYVQKKQQLRSRLDRWKNVWKSISWK